MMYPFQSCRVPWNLCRGLLVEDWYAEDGASGGTLLNLKLWAMVYWERFVTSLLEICLSMSIGYYSMRIEGLV